MCKTAKEAQFNARWQQQIDSKNVSQKNYDKADNQYKLMKAQVQYGTWAINNGLMPSRFSPSDYRYNKAMSNIKDRINTMHQGSKSLLNMQKQERLSLMGKSYHDIFLDPFYQHNHARIETNQIEKIINLATDPEYGGYSLAFLTITIKNVPMRKKAIEAAYKKLHKTVNLLGSLSNYKTMKNKAAKAGVAVKDINKNLIDEIGSVKYLSNDEFTFNRKTNTLHPHIHCLLFISPNFAELVLRQQKSLENQNKVLASKGLKPKRHIPLDKELAELASLVAHQKTTEVSIQTPTGSSYQLPNKVPTHEQLMQSDVAKEVASYISPDGDDKHTNERNGSNDKVVGNGLWIRTNDGKIKPAAPYDEINQVHKAWKGKKHRIQSDFIKSLVSQIDSDTWLKTHTLDEAPTTEFDTIESGFSVTNIAKGQETVMNAISKIKKSKQFIIEKVANQYLYELQLFEQMEQLSEQEISIYDDYYRVNSKYEAELKILDRLFIKSQGRVANDPNASHINGFELEKIVKATKYAEKLGQSKRRNDKKQAQVFARLICFCENDYFSNKMISSKIDKNEKDTVQGFILIIRNELIENKPNNVQI